MSHFRTIPLTEHPIELDFETYSEAGYEFIDGVPVPLPGSIKGRPGLPSVGAAVYAEHPSFEVLCMAYADNRLWTYRDVPPSDLFDYIERGGLIEAHNSLFEFFVWWFYCHKRLGWPMVPLRQWRCSQARAKAFALPGGLKNASAVMGTAGKLDSGGALIKLFCMPHKPAKSNGFVTRVKPENAPERFGEFCRYNIQDIVSERELSRAIPELTPFELEVWKLDQRINARGVQVDTMAIEACKAMVSRFSAVLIDELKVITGGRVISHEKLTDIKVFIQFFGTSNPSGMAKDDVEKALSREQDPVCRRVLEIRQLLGLSSIKKLNALSLRANSDGRIRGMFSYCGAERTGRWSGGGVQPQNLPGSGPLKKWGPEEVEECLRLIQRGDLETMVARYDGKVIEAISGCLRGLFIAALGHKLICSDFSSIEAVVLAVLAGETWRIKVFTTHGKIYESSASKMSGIPLEEILAHPKRHNGEKHPLRKRGKVRELANGYGGWIGANKNFGAGEFMSDDEIKADILKWRDESPAIVEFWGGQERKHRTCWKFTPELYGIEGAVVASILNPGRKYSYRLISVWFDGKNFYIQLPSGRRLTYHSARLVPVKSRLSGNTIYSIRYMGWNSDSTKGAVGWVELDTYAGKLTENIVQAVARDIQAFSMINLDKAGYPIVLHVHDESAAEVLEGTGSIQHYEWLMQQRATWFRDWPIRASGGWMGPRFGKR